MGQAACPRGHALDVRPPPGQGLLEECLGESLPHDASVFMQPRLGSRGGTFHGRGRPSEDVLLSIGPRYTGFRRVPAALLGVPRETAARWKRRYGLRLTVSRRGGWRA